MKKLFLILFILSLFTSIAIAQTTVIVSIKGDPVFSYVLEDDADAVEVEKVVTNTTTTTINP